MLTYNMLAGYPGKTIFVDPELKPEIFRGYLDLNDMLYGTGIKCRCRYLFFIKIYAGISAS
jgi:hypothetical protein